MGEKEIVGGLQHDSSPKIEVSEGSPEKLELENVPDGYYYISGADLIPNPKHNMGPLSAVQVIDNKFYQIDHNSADLAIQEITRPERPCHDNDYRLDYTGDCSHCGAKFEGWFTTDRDSGREYKLHSVNLNRDGQPVAQRFTFGYQKWDKEPTNIPVALYRRKDSEKVAE